MMIQQHDGVVVDAAELRQGFAKLILAPNGRHLRVQHTSGQHDVSSVLIQQGGRRG